MKRMHTCTAIGEVLEAHPRWYKPVALDIRARFVELHRILLA